MAECALDLQGSADRREPVGHPRRAGLILASNNASPKNMESEGPPISRPRDTTTTSVRTASRVQQLLGPVRWQRPSLLNHLP